MTIEEYLTGVDRIYYQLSVIVEGKQLLVDGNSLFLDGEVPRLTDIRDMDGKLGKVRFSTLSIPAQTEIDVVGIDHAIINYGDIHLTIWPIGGENAKRTK